MSVTASQSIYDAYAAKFDNLDEVTHVMLAFNPQYLQLLQDAIAKGEPLSREQINEVFGDPGWDE